MDDKLKQMGFKDFITVDYTMTGDEYLAYQAQKRRRGHYDTWGDDYTPEGEELTEVLSNAQRVKAGQRMKRMSKRIQMAKKRAMRRAPSMDVLKKRAKKQARTDLLKKMSKGVSKQDMSMGQRAAFEKRLKAKEKAIERNAKKLIPSMRQKDKDRRAAARKSQSEK